MSNGDRSVTARRAVYWLAAVTAALLSAFLKARLSFSLPQFDPADDTAYFHVESALQYRYAKLLALGPPPPAVDLKAQYPEGLRLDRDVSLTMERATAWTFRALRPRIAPDAFHRFVVVWAAAVSSLGVLALAWLGLSLGGGPAAAAACFAFAGCWPAVSSVAGAYGFQCFALPLLLLCVAATAQALESDGTARRVCGASAASALAVALDAWHFSRFFLLGLWPALAYAAWRSRADVAARPRLLAACLWLLAGALASGLLCGPLRETRFLASPAFLSGIVLACALRFGLRAAATAAAAAALAALWQGRAEAGAYGHVWGLLWAKIACGLAKPDDPARLPESARLLWTGPFDSPAAGPLFFSFFPLSLTAGARLWARPSQTAEPAADLCDALLALYALGALLVARLSPVLAFFLCAAAMRPSALRPALLAAALTAVAALETAKTAAARSPLNPVLRLSASLDQGPQPLSASLADERQALAWLREEGAASPVAADFGVSASILAYTPSPVLLQPKFESAGARAKVAAYLRALYADEDAFYGFCRANGARWLLYSASDALDDTVDGPRYMAGVGLLRGDTTALRLQFFPEKLRRFRLVKENEGYRLFAVGEPGKALKRQRAVYDIAQFKPQERSDGALVLDVAGALQRRQAARVQLALAQILTDLGRRREADQALRQARSFWPD